ncbi:hydrogenase small subunit [Geomonas nitrogeniifigens]|uniref:Hydrogenase small subunit n=1 Tax=Geomonas diazotrophica TaxID=2843197 RepID=A0ABX8JHH9_9BACT|nr:hydrogenase small subunit [Geomonas nitrogeniifigens]QWV97819.1 hydrogenase small subunit [Geomonas nitrogeniifigens]QXE86959.1 hydrogenase small subunit [Geomonas nitrogeniifigens]
MSKTRTEARDDSELSIGQILKERGVSRRDFLKFCSTVTAALALPPSFAPSVARALDEVKRPPLVWLEFQGCTGDSEALLRSANPTVAEIILDILSVDYHETIMASAGHQAEAALDKTITDYKGKYFAVIEGSIPMKDGGVYGCVGGKSHLERARQVCGGAAATIAIGTCASYGGIPAAAPNPTGAVGVKEAVPGATVINLPGCPCNADNLTATIVHYLVFNKIPALDGHGRPLFAYGKRIHDNCERRPHFDAGQYVEHWGDEGHRKGYCLYKMGCKGPATFHNCPTQRYNEKTAWPIGSGHPCVGCAEPQFWDVMSPMYRRLPNVPGFGIEHTADAIGLGLAAGAAGAFVVHGALSAMRKDKEPGEDAKED